MRNGVLHPIFVFGVSLLVARISGLRTMAFLAHQPWILRVPFYHIAPWGVVFLHLCPRLLLSGLLMLVIDVGHLRYHVVWFVDLVDWLLVLTLAFDLRLSHSGNRISYLMRLQLRWLFLDDIVRSDCSLWLVPTISFVTGSSQAGWKCISNFCGPWIFHICFQWDRVSIFLMHALGG